MKSYSEVSGEIFSINALRMYRAAKKVVNRIEASGGCRRGTKEWIRCHEVVRIVQGVLSPRWQLVVVDGLYGQESTPKANHSWCVLDEPSTGNYVTRYILDVYAVGRLPMVQLVACDYLHRTMYNPTDLKILGVQIDDAFVREQIKELRRVRVA